MERTAFIRSLVATVGVTQLAHAAPALAAIDEPSITALGRWRRAWY